MPSKQHVIRRLTRIAAKYRDFFDAQGLSIFDCVLIKTDGMISVHPLNDDLPFDLQFDIETACWID